MSEKNKTHQITVRTKSFKWWENYYSSTYYVVFKNLLSDSSSVQRHCVFKCFGELSLLEPVCCKKQQKKVPDQLLVCGIGDLWRTWMIPNWLYMSPCDSPDHPRSIFQRSPIPQTSNWSGTFFAASYSKPTLATELSFSLKFKFFQILQKK